MTGRGVACQGRESFLDEGVSCIEHSCRNITHIEDQKITSIDLIEPYFRSCIQIQMIISMQRGYNLVNLFLFGDWLW